MSNYKAINAEILAISILTMEASQQGVAVCFCDYAGHTQQVDVRIYPPLSSWLLDGSMPEKIYSDSIYTDRPEALNELRYVRIKVIQALDHLRKSSIEPAKDIEGAENIAALNRRIVA